MSVFPDYVMHYLFTASGEMFELIDLFSANEYVGKKEGERQVVLKMCEERETLTVLSADRKKPLRVIDYKYVFKNMYNPWSSDLF